MQYQEDQGIKESLLAKKDIKTVGFWDNWIYLSLTAMTCFVCANITNSTLSHMHFETVYYWSTGPFIVCIIYFIITAFQ